VGSSPSSVRSLTGSETPRVFTAPLRELTRKTSRGWECIEFVEQVLAITLLPWQKWMLIHALELLDDGTFRFRTVVLLVARQSGKSTLMQVLSLWRMYVDAAPLVIGTAQNLDIAEEVWQGAVDMAQETPELAAEIEQVFMNTGKKYLRLTSGSRYKVQAAGRRGGRGLSGDLVLMDELREHQTWEAWAAVTNTTMARAKAQVWAASNAGDATSVVLSHLRLQAHRALGDPDGICAEVYADESDESLGLFEWSAAPGTDIWDRAGWTQANPALGYTTTERALIAAAAAPEARFRTENLCQWVDTMREGAFPGGVWATNRVDPATPVTGKPVVALDVRTGLLQSYALCVAAQAKGFDLIDVAKYELGADTQWSEDHVVSETAKLLKALDVGEVVVDEYAENGHLIPLLETAGIRVRKLKLHDMRDGARGLTDALINGNVKHTGAEALSVAVLGAGKRTSGEGFVWSQTKSTTDVSPLRAATAAWWVLHTDGADYDVMASFY
jgi:phage terminase large subunit-like protein